jgi:site-specific DNA-adenine methylase
VIPFFGSGVEFFLLDALGLLAPGCRVVLGDASPELIAFWRLLVQDGEAVEGLICEAGEVFAAYNALPDLDAKEAHFGVVRGRLVAHQRAGAYKAAAEAASTESDAALLADFVYMNRAGFNGLWRVAKDGSCNVPWGKRVTITLPEEALRAAGGVLARVQPEIVRGDFAATTLRAAGAWMTLEVRGQLRLPGTPSPLTAADLLVLDPPYGGARAKGFVQYTRAGFSAKDQRLVAYLAGRWLQSGGSVSLTNGAFPGNAEAYRARGLVVRETEERRVGNRDGAGRGAVPCLLATRRGSG